MSIIHYPIFWDIETTGLNPMIEPWMSWEDTARITAIAIGHIPDWDDDCKERKLHCVLNEGNGEYELIEKAREHVKHVIEDYAFDNELDPVMVGWNIYQFDAPYWSARCGRLRQDPYPFGYGVRRLDMMRALELSHDHPNGPKKHPKQQEYAEWLGIEYLDELSGDKMPKAFFDGDYQMIKDHVVDDVEVLMEIFRQERHLCLKELYSHYDDIPDTPPVLGDVVDLSEEVDEVGGS